MYYIQIECHDTLYAKAKAQYTSISVKEGNRGEIFDYNGNLLVGNLPCADICADPQLVGGRTECVKIARFFATRLRIKASKIYKRLMRKTRIKKLENGKEVVLPVKYASIASKVDYELSESLRDEVAERGFKGIFFSESTKRYYPKGTLLSNILGFTNIDRDRAIAVIGIEKFFNSEISPTNAKSKFERGRDGVLLSYGQRNDASAKDGLNIYLTIKEPVQAILEEELDKLYSKWKPRAAYAVMADPYTGDIIAVAQRPTFNPNTRESMSPDAWRNRVTEDVFEPGSTLKPIVVAGALDYGIVTPSTRFDCENGYWVYAGKPLRDSHPMKSESVASIIQKSSNIGTAKIALAMGKRLLYTTLKRFGIGERTGVPLKPETKGIFRSLGDWDRLSITRFPIGQGLALSPLQLVRAYCALANGGHLVDLRMVDRMENPETGTIVENPISKSYRIYRKKDTHRQVIDMMKRVTQDGGTATKAAIKGYDVAGKTGTSQKFIDGAYSHSKYFSTFIGFVPAEKPAFVLLVTADEPKESYYGGTVAAPTFSRIAERTLRYMNVVPKYYNNQIKNQ